MNIKALIGAAALFLAARASAAQDDCARALKAWESAGSYQCVYRAFTSHEKKRSESLMLYSYEKPGKIRMDIEKPRKGAVLIYNPEISKKVKVRPFPNLPFFVLNYGLTDSRVSSDSGGTVESSDLGSRMRSVCGEPPDQGPGKTNTRCTFSAEGFLTKIETTDGKGGLAESYEWKDLKVNVKFKPDFFTKF